MSAMGMTLYDLLCRSASVHASRPAVHCEKGRFTYPELLGRVDQLANGLDGLGLEQGQTVCVLAQNSVEYFELYFACAKLGVIVYPINWRLTAAEIGHVLTRAAPVAMVYDVTMAEVANEVRGGEQAKDVKHWICVENDDEAKASEMASLYVEGECPQRSLSADDIDDMSRCFFRQGTREDRE